MAKTFKKMETTYTASVKAVVKSADDMDILTFDVATDSKNANIIRKVAADGINRILENSENYKGYSVVPRDIKVLSVAGTATVHVWKVDATTEEIIAACEKAGLSVADFGIMTDEDADADSESDEN